VEELVFWQSNLDYLNGRRICPGQLELPIWMLVTPDMAVASLNLGPRWPRKVFGRLIQQRKVPLCMRFWPLEKFCNLLLLSLQDYVSNGTNEVCVHHGISIEAEWVPRYSNEQADYLSRLVDIDDWSVSPQIFLHFSFEMGDSLY